MRLTVGSNSVIHPPILCAVLRMRLLVRFLLGAVLVLPSLGQAQERHQFTVDAGVLRGTIRYAHAVAPAVHVGSELGFGFPQIDYTVVPSEVRWHGGASFEEYLHTSVFLRHRVQDWLAYDAGLRASIVDLWACTASDCLPATFVGAYVQPMFGGRRWSLGPRLVAGWTAESEDGGDSTFTISVAPLNVRLTLGR